MTQNLPGTAATSGGTESGGHPLAHDVNWLLHRAALGVAEARTRVLAGLGLSVREAVLLAVLARVPGRTQSELASLIKMDKSVFTTAMDGLERKGLIVRRADPRDRRVRRPELTREGRARCGKAEEAYAAVQSEVLAVLPPASRSQLVEALQALVFGPFAEVVSYAPPTARR
jgi:MarR family transcriptional regulator, organic hydroperoxide resistance regulator